MSHSFNGGSGQGPVSGSNEAQVSASPGYRTSMARRISRQTSDGDLAALLKAFEKSAEAHGVSASEFKFTIVPTSDGIRLPILAIWAKLGKSVYTFGYVLWNGQNIPDYVVQQTNARIPRYPGDCCDAFAGEAMVARVRRDAGLAPTDNVVNVSLAVISTEVDVNNEEQISDLLYTAGNAIETNAEQRNDLPTDNTTLDSLRSATGNLQSSIYFGNGNITNLFSLPVRADVRIEVTQTSGSKNQNNLHGNDEVLTVLDGYFEPSYAPADMVEANYRAAQNAINIPGAPQPRLNRRFVMTFVVTNFDYFGSHGAVNLEAKLMALASVSALLRSPYQWAEAYRSTYGQSNPWRNIGALARELPQLTNAKASPDAVPGKAVDALAPQFDISELHKFVDQVCWPDLAIAIDVDENGPWSWMESVFIQAAGVYDSGNNQISTRARKYITSRLDAVTSGAFSKHFNPGAAFFQPQTFRMHRGYFELDGRGVLDIRELGLLELLNAGTDRASYDNAIEYVKTFEETSRPEHERQAKRLEVFQQTLGGGSNLIKVVGNTRRLILTSDFTAALLASFGAAGLAYQGDPLRFGATASSSRGAQYLNGAILAPSLGNAYVQSPSVGGAVNVGYNPVVGSTSLWN